MQTCTTYRPASASQHKANTRQSGSDLVIRQACVDLGNGFPHEILGQFAHNDLPCVGGQHAAKKPHGLRRRAKDQPPDRVFDDRPVDLARDPMQEDMLILLAGVSISHRRLVTMANMIMTSMVLRAVFRKFSEFLQR